VAIDPSAAYAGQVDTSDPTGYPHGKAQNSASLGDGIGFPLEKAWVNDLLGFEQALLAAAGAVPSGTPDKVGASQYLSALKNVIRQAQINAQVFNWPHRVSIASYGGPVNSGVAMAWSSLGMGYASSPLFCAMGKDLNVLTSEDGVTWTAGANLPNANFVRPCLALGMVSGVQSFLVPGNGAGATIYKSVDGVTWTSQSVSHPPNGAVVYATDIGLWVIAGDGGAISTSPDGVAWTARTTPGHWAGCGGAKRVVRAAGLFMVLPAGTFNTFLTSPDGVTWTEQTVGSEPWTGIAYSATDGIWMAVSSTSVIATSTNAVAWAATSPGTFPGANDLAVNGSLWVIASAGAAFGGIMWSADRGATWSIVAVGQHRVAANGWDRILFNGQRFMVAHATGTALEFALSLSVP